MNTNGVNEKALTSRPLAALGTLEKRPVMWGGALKLCRMAAKMSVPDLINKAFTTATRADVSKGDVAKWEAGDTYPTARQCKLLRKFLPALRHYEDLLRLELREDPKHRDGPDVPPPDLGPPTKWIGAPVATFGAGLRYCREKDGMRQSDVALAMGVTNTTISHWETDGRSKGPQEFRVIQEVYDRLCEIFPMLQFAPKPPLSPFYQNQFKTEKWVESREARGNQARETHTVNLAIAAHEEQKRVEAEAAKPPPIDFAPANQAGANYGVLKSALYALQAKKRKMEDEHKAAMDRLTEEIGTQAKAVEAAELEMMRVAGATHGVEL